MAIYILGPDQNGDCCACEQRINVCDTCTTPLCFQTRVKQAIGFTTGIGGGCYGPGCDGNVGICGFVEYVASTPPKAYTTETVNGEVTFCISIFRDICEEGAAYTSTIRDFSDTACSYTSGTPCYPTPPIVGAYIQSVGQASSPTDHSMPCGTIQTVSNPSGCRSDMFDDPLRTTITATHTTYRVQGNDICVPYGLPGGLSSKILGDATAVLTNEYTEQDAINYGLGNSSWGAWSDTCRLCSGCQPCTTGLAQYQDRDNGYNFKYFSAEWAINRSGLLTGRTYDTSVLIYRSLYGSGQFSLYQTLHLEGTTTTAGFLGFTGTVPNDKGYETYATSDCIWSPV